LDSKIAQGLDGGEREATGEEGVQLNSERGKWIPLTAVKGYLYPKNPHIPG
jgi:hypothetical protein